MRLTTKTSYGIRALIDLAVVYKSGLPLSIKEISREEGISGIYLEQIFHRLRKEGFVESVRGPKGGYILSKKPSDLSVYKAVVALEGSVAPGRCSHHGKKTGKECARAAKCTSKEVWDEVARQIKNTLEKFSLDDMARRALELDPGKLGKVRSDAKGIS
jgi:Rrf2 family protein